MGETPKFQVEWAEVARTDLYAIIEYIAERDVNAARRISQRIEHRAASLASMPLRGRVIPELAAFGIYSYRDLSADSEITGSRIASRRQERGAESP